MKSILFFLLFLAASNSFAQFLIQGYVKDLNSKQPLSFCSVAVKGTSRGCIANEEGLFNIRIETVNDSLTFSYVGYETKTVDVLSLSKSDGIFLKPLINILKEAQIHASDDYLYDLLIRCRNKINSSGQQTSKVYFELETEVGEQPVEILECYYNGEFRASSLENLSYKNGRIGLAPINQAFFVNLNTSKAITELNLSKSNEDIPFIPLQYGKSKLNKLFKLELLSVNEQNIYCIGFRARNDNGKFFNGELWMDTKTFSLLKIHLVNDSALQHPFVPLFPDDSIKSVSFNITETFSVKKNELLPEHLDFNYNILYKSAQGKLENADIRVSNAEKKIKVDGVMYFYDYGMPFMLPHYQFDTDESDYRKISSLPYNEKFWSSSTGLVFTEKQKRNLDFFKQNGLVLNYASQFITTRAKSDDGKNHNRFFENSNILWSDTARLSLKKDFANLQGNIAAAKPDPHNFQVCFDLYNLDAQIYLDVNSAGDSFNHFSASVLNVFKSYYKIPPDSTTDCFINIYFDLYEIQRRSMEKALNAERYTASQIDAVYQQSVQQANTQANLYLREVQSGKNIRALSKWNQYVLDNLGVDNIKLFGLAIEKNTR